MNGLWSDILEKEMLRILRAHDGPMARSQLVDETAAALGMERSPQAETWRVLQALVTDGRIVERPAPFFFAVGYMHDNFTVELNVLERLAIEGA